MRDDAGKLLLRLTVGLLMLPHGLAKVGSGTAGIEGMLSASGLPGQLAWGVYIGELIAPLMVVFGFHARTGGVLIAVNMLFAVGLAHLGDLARLGAGGGWALELQAFFLLTAVAVALVGPGRYAINRY